MTQPEAHTTQSRIPPAASVEFSVQGEGKLPLVFLNGFRMPKSSWHKLIGLLPANRCMLLYNRAGVGHTPKATVAQTAQQVVNDLRNLLDQLNIKPPYIVVAHSLGGIFANYFARRYPQEIAGIIFLDASHPEEIIAQRQFSPPALLNWINNAIKSLEKMGNPFKYSEDEMIDESLVQITNAGSFPEIPICIISGTQKLPLVPAASFELHCKYQQELLRLSPLAEYHPLEKSGHFPQISEPEALAAIINQWLKTLKG
ncbi:MAG: hypothetical protein B0W54_17720 [Cellvibrio sp. 79]|nr:MAG: hypothetical protein B0W54_17720 [Cellvibrio sp. 79]